jgi:hypothetical protein
VLRHTHRVQNTSTYHEAIFACEFVKAGRVGLTLMARTMLLVAVIDDVKIVVIKIVAEKDIGDEFQE